MKRWGLIAALCLIAVPAQAMDVATFLTTAHALKAKGIKTLIVVGWKVSGSVTYTSVGAMARDYTVVVPVDTTSAGSDYETTIGFYNVLNSGNANLANEPLKPKATTLSRTDMITAAEILDGHRRGAVAFDLDDQFRIRKPNAVAGRRSEHRGIGTAADRARHLKGSR